MTPPVASALLLGLAWFAAVNLVASLVVTAAARPVLASAARSRGGMLLALRLAPAFVSIAFVVAFFLPAHWRFEPADARESFGVVLYVLAAIGAALIARSGLRLVAVARAGLALRACRRFEHIDPALGAYEVPGLAGVSLAGVFRTHVLVGAPVMAALTTDELRVALAHELAHRSALDNLKRFLLFCAPDVVSFSAAGRRLDEQWRAATEWLADARAVAGDAVRALHLASALVKVSRMATTEPSVGSPVWSSLHDLPLLETRVRRLVDANTPSARRARPAPAAVITAALALALLSFAAVPWPALHHLTERLVRLLP